MQWSLAVRCRLCAVAAEYADKKRPRKRNQGMQFSSHVCNGRHCSWLCVWLSCDHRQTHELGRLMTHEV
jgi:hypothetical protein